MIIKLGNQIKNDQCGLDDEEIESLVKIVSHRKRYIADVCEMMGCCQKTLENMVEDGRLPEWRKEPGGKKYMWEDEINEWTKKNNL